MITLPYEAKAVKNQPENTPIYLYILYDYDGAGTNLEFAAWDEDIIYDDGDGAITYSAFPVGHDSISENSNGGIDAVSLTVANVSRLIQSYLEDYDLRGKKVLVRLVWLEELDDDEAHIDHYYYVDSYTADEQNVSFTLSSKYDVMDSILPGRTFIRNTCGWTFKGSECGYTGAETVCNRTFQRCIELNNYSRYGGFPSIP